MIGVDGGDAIAGTRHVAAGAAALLGLAEAVTRVVLGGTSVQFGIVFCLFALCTTLPVVLPHPIPAALAVTSACVLSLALFHGLTVAGFGAQVVVLYRLGRHDGRWWATALAVPFVVLALVRPVGGETGVLTVLLASVGPAAVLLGIARRALGQALVHRAARQAVAGTLLEHTARGERARIARELHDVVAHHISMIAVQAETARLTTPGLPAAGAQRLSEIGDTARAGLTEMRRLLGVLREDAGTEVAQRQPQPDLRQLNDLLDDARDTSGGGTRLIVSGAPVPLDPGVELAAYRIVQEALTNARRHAPGAAVDVELHYAADVLRVRIRDNGPGPPVEPVGGHGLLGMRERAAAVGGQLRTGPTTIGGFLVEATLPATSEEAE
jgi:signal transduction histidine kinase